MEVEQMPNGELYYRGERLIPQSEITSIAHVVLRLGTESGYRRLIATLEVLPESALEQVLELAESLVPPDDPDDDFAV